MRQLVAGLMAVAQGGGGVVVVLQRMWARPVTVRWCKHQYLTI